MTDLLPDGLNSSELLDLQAAVRRTRLSRVVPSLEHLSNEDLAAMEAQTERGLKKLEPPAPKKPPSKINGWEIVKWESRNDFASFTVKDEGGHKLTFDNVWFGGNKLNALTWATDQIIAYEAAGNFEFVCDHCKAKKPDADGRTQEQRDALDVSRETSDEV